MISSKCAVVPVDVVAPRAQFLGLWIEQGEAGIGATDVCDKASGREGPVSIEFIALGYTGQDLHDIGGARSAYDRRPWSE